MMKSEKLERLAVKLLREAAEARKEETEKGLLPEPRLRRLFLVRDEGLQSRFSDLKVGQIRNRQNELDQFMLQNKGFLIAVYVAKACEWSLLG